jgi:hypothetical protein
MIKLLVSIAGADFSYAPGETVSLDAELERRLIDSGQAEEVNERVKPNHRTKRTAS